MRTIIIKSCIVIAAIVEITCGSFLLLPWYAGEASYIHPQLAFFGAILFVAVGGYFLALGTFGFRGFIETRSGKLLFKEVQSGK